MGDRMGSQVYDRVRSTPGRRGDDGQTPHRGRARRLGQPRPHPRRSAWLAAGRRRDVRRADDGPARAAHRRAHRRRRGGRDRPTSSTCSATAGVDLVARSARRRRRSSTTARRPPGASRSATSVGEPLGVRTSRHRGGRPGLVAGPGRRRDRRRLGGASSRRTRTSCSAGRGSCATSSPGRAGRAPRPDAVGAAPPRRPGRGEPSRRRGRHEPGRPDRVPPPGRRPARHRRRPGRPAAPRRRPTAREARPLPADRHGPGDRSDGAGDTFLAALLASVLRPAIVGRARSRRSPDLRFAAAAGSLAVEESRPRRGPGSRGRARPACAGARPPWRSVPSEVAQVGPVETLGLGSSAGARGLSRLRDRSRIARRSRSASSAGSGRPSRRRRSIGVEPTVGGRERRRPVAQAMLADLRQLDRGDDGGASRAGGQRRPCLDRVLVPAEAAQEVGAIDGDPLHRPGAATGRAAGPERRRRDAPWRSAEVGRSPGRPPGRVVERLPDGDTRRDEPGRVAVAGRSGVRSSSGRSAAASRQSSASGEPALAGERAGQTREVAGRRHGPRRRVAVAVVRGGRAASRATGRPGRCGGRPRRGPRPGRRAGTRGSDPGSRQPSTSPTRCRPSSSASAVRSRASGIRCRNSRRTIGSRSRWPAWAGAARRASR